MAFARASFFEMSVCACRPSMICQPMVYTGFRAVEGSWKIIATSVPRTDLRFFFEREMTSCSAVPALFDRITAPRVVAVSGSSPRMVLAVTVLPLPDSPTIASTSPRSTDNETSSTAFTAPASVANETPSPLMSTTVLTA